MFDESDAISIERAIPVFTLRSTSPALIFYHNRQAVSISISPPCACDILPRTQKIGRGTKLFYIVQREIRRNSEKTPRESGSEGMCGSIFPNPTCIAAGICSMIIEEEKAC